MWLDTLYHNLNPIAISLGPLAIRWYGLAYLAGFIVAAFVIYRIQKRWGFDLTGDELSTILVAIAFGVIFGGRLGYVLFYGDGYYFAHPLKILAFSEGGMSFHGGLVGAIILGSLAAKRLKISIASFADMAVIGATWGLFFGRLANFVNGELWGKETTLPWGVMFSDTGGGMIYRHPSQLYEAALEGLVLFLILYLLARKKEPLPQGSYLAVFLLGYGVFRFLIEFVRLPDKQLGYLFGTNWFTMGQMLSLPLIVLGVCLLVYSLRTARPQKLRTDS